MVLLVAGLTAYTVVNGELRLPFGSLVFAADRSQPDQGIRQPAGTVAVLACPRELPAFTKLTREHLLDAEGLHTVPVVEQALESNRLFRADADGVGRLLGRVLKRSKPVNFAFSESDLLPAGTQAGPSAGVPPGCRGVWVDLAKVQGLADVRSGDLLDLVAAQKVDAPPPVGIEHFGGISDPVLRARLKLAATNRNRGTHARSWVVAREALVVATPRRREVVTAVVRRGQMPMIVEEVFLAMKPEDVARLSQALAQDVTLVAAPRTGQPGEDSPEIEDLAPQDPAADLRRMLLGDAQEPSLGMIELIRGNSRETLTVPRAGASQGGR